jgi:hypothetical protein
MRKFVAAAAFTALLVTVPVRVAAAPAPSAATCATLDPEFAVGIEGPAAAPESGAENGAGDAFEVIDLAVPGSCGGPSEHIIL